MSKFYSREEREQIQALNLVLGMHHRDKPYDFNDISDLREAAIKTIAEYMDYKNYWSVLDSMSGTFDESIELYDPLTWLALAREDISGDHSLLTAYGDLADAEKSMYEVYERSEKRCGALLKIIMGKEESVQKEIWGHVYEYKDDKIESLFMEALELSSTYSLEESFKVFCELMSETLK